MASKKLLDLASRYLIELGELQRIQQLNLSVDARKEISEKIDFDKFILSFISRQLGRPDPS